MKSIYFAIGEYVVYVDAFMPDTVEIITGKSKDLVFFDNGSRCCIPEMIRLAEKFEIQQNIRFLEPEELPFI